MHLPYDVLRDLIYFHDRINDLFEEKLISVYPNTELSQGATWTPAVDIYETGEIIYLTAELPGVALKDIRIEVADSELALRGNRPFPRPDRRSDEYRRLEGGYGGFERRFPLPTPVDRDAIRANLKDGVLKVVIPKLPVKDFTKIPIENR